MNSTVKRAYRIFGPPATFFIDGKGIIRDIVLGPITAERAREAMKKIGDKRALKTIGGEHWPSRIRDRSGQAVKKWLFEPVRAWNTPVAVWVLLPVKFALE